MTEHATGNSIAAAPAGKAAFEVLSGPRRADLRHPRSPAPTRVALVIGNSAYQHTRVLPNSRNDAEAIAGLLRASGFADVTLKNDLDYRAMREVIRAFGGAAREADIALIYYAGHGIEVAGQNYLVPVDAKLLRNADLEYETVTLASVLSAVGRAKRLRVVVLDACRNNPLGESMSLGAGVTRTVTRGLARIEPRGDVLVAYSARAGTLAQDGKGKHSPYAEALLKHMMTPGLDVRLMFGKVRDQVLLATGGEQEPFIYGSLSGEVIPLAADQPAPKMPSSAEAKRKPNEVAPAPARLKISAWDGVINSRDQKFYKFIEGNKDKIIRITGAAEEGAAPYDRQLKQCIIGHTQSDGTGTEYLIDCSWRNGEWRVNGFFTQQEWLFSRGVMTIPLQRAADGMVLSQNPEVIPFKSSKR